MGAVVLQLKALGQGKVEEHRVKEATSSNTNKVAPKAPDAPKEWWREDRMVAVSSHGKTMSVGIDYEEEPKKSVIDYSGADFSDTPAPKQPLPRGDAPKSKSGFQRKPMPGLEL